MQLLPMKEGGMHGKVADRQEILENKPRFCLLFIAALSSLSANSLSRP